MKRLLLPALLFAAVSLQPAHAQVKITPDGDVVHVEIDGKPFTDFVERGGEAMKPYMAPLRSASGKIVTRQYPMATVEGEPTDHPHHRGLWFAHQGVNGLDFWNNETSYKTANRGRIEVAKIDETTSGAEAGTLKATMNWLAADGTKLIEESRTTVFHRDPKLRIIDLDITLTAAAKVTFADSKDGVFGLRVAAPLQETGSDQHKAPKPGAPPVPDTGSKFPATGTMTNAEGLTKEAGVWGKPSNWVDYAGTLDGEKLGVAVFEHPSNTPRAVWHSRGYGLFANNPFGRKAFGDKEHDGSVTLEPGGKLRFRYRVVIHPGDTASAELPKLWKEYTEQVK